VAITGEYPECPKCGHKNQKFTRVAQNERVDSWTDPEQKLPIDQKVVLVSDFEESRAAIAYYGNRGHDGVEWLAIDMSGMYEMDIDVEVWKDLPIAEK
jgi:predicted  nucleic acid-binding Zn-ribbon protein